MKKLTGYVFLIVIATFLASCASKYMRPVATEAISSYTPSNSESVIVFMRPSSLGFAIQSSVFDVTTQENILVGIVSSKTKVAYKTSPGEHLFMVIGESADFMKTNLDGGNIYYALVTPRIGVWKARFSLKPIHKDELNNKDFRDWNNSCEYVENTDASHQWAKDNAESIQSKREDYYQKWISKPEADRPLLNKEDGI